MATQLSGEATYPAFLQRLLTRESGIDPTKFDWYCKNLDIPVCNFCHVERPGRVVRDFVTGQPITSCMSVTSFFRSLGVSDRFDPIDNSCLVGMRYAAINPFGFVGYQFGEAILISTGYYQPKTVLVEHRGNLVEVETYYFGSVDPATWARKRRTAVYEIPASRKIILATDVNEWTGTFTGLDDIHDLADLLEPSNQELVIRNVMSYQAKTLLKGIFNQNSPTEVIDRPVMHFLNRCIERLGSDITFSSLLAGAHLCGPFAVLAYPSMHHSIKDEIGTTIEDYFRYFAGFETPFINEPDVSR